MLKGVYDLLAAKRAEYAAAAARADALRDYWTARAALERATGGDLPQGDL
jgi:outer membrane protein, heavy metal efflux system